jgi:2-isopropylmalate synthase
MPVQPNKAIVGENAFAHSSGIHQDGVLKAQNTYEIMAPEQVGIRQNELNLTSRSGRHVIQHRLAELGYTNADYDLEAVYKSFVALADQKGRVFDYDLEALVFFENMQEQNDYYALEFLSSSTHTGHVASATVGLRCGDKVFTEAATGNGPVEAAFSAIARISKLDIKMVDFNLQAKGSGEDALGQVDIIAEHEGRRFHGAGLATDIVRSSVLAYVHVLNMIQRAQTIDAHKHARQTTTKIAAGEQQ